MEKTSEKVEKELRSAIITGTLLPGVALGSERELALQYGVTRPTVREALQRLAQDGWITVSPRRATLVNDFWLHGNLNILATIAENVDCFPLDLVQQLLEFRLVNAPVYAANAVGQGSPRVIAFLADACAAADDPRSFAERDWELHRTLAVLSGSRIYPLMLNSFANLYRVLGAHYFSSEQCREASRNYYRRLLQLAVDGNAVAAGELTREAMEESMRLWDQLMASAGAQEVSR